MTKVAKVGDKIRIEDGYSEAFTLGDVFTVKEVKERLVYVEETWDCVYHEEYNVLSEGEVAE